MLFALVRARTFYPSDARARGVTGAVGVTFTVGAGGRVGAVTIVKTSGSEELDGAARQIVRSIEPPPPPGGSFFGRANIDFHTE